METLADWLVLMAPALIGLLCIAIGAFATRKR
jgi:hypothetical protein